jgi:uncharacterized protein YbjT (DUF2867 family)
LSGYASWRSGSTGCQASASPIPGYFYSNFLYNVGLIRAAGINGGLLDPDVQVAMADPGDIASVAATLLARPAFTGQTIRELRAARAYSLREATGILSRAIGRPDLPCVPFSEADTRQALHGMGSSPAMASLYVEMVHALNLVQPRQPLSAETTAPTALEKFARTTFAPTFAQ